MYNGYLVIIDNATNSNSTFMTIYHCQEMHLKNADGSKKPAKSNTTCPARAHHIDKVTEVTDYIAGI